MVSRAALKILGHDPETRRSPLQDPNGATDTQLETKVKNSFTLLLSQEQEVELEKAANDVKLSVQSLVHVISKCLGDETGVRKVRRMLPATPSAGRGLVRAQSARVKSTSDRHFVSKRFSMTFD